MKSTLIAILVLAVVGTTVYFSVQYFSSLTTPLQILSELNPRNAPKANLSQTIPTTLTSAILEVPENMRTGAFATDRILRAPKGVSISVYASGMQKPRLLAFSPAGVPFVTDMDAGTVYAMPDPNGDGSADRLVPFATGLSKPHGIAFRKDEVLLAEERNVRVLRDTNGDLIADENRIIIDDLPTGGSHVTRTMAIDSEGSLYVSVGSSCNVCKDDGRRAAILRFKADGSDEVLFARGTRNAVGLAWKPGTDELWATDNGRDFLGDDLPPDEVNVLKENGDYGWPRCYGKSIADTSQKGSEAECPGTLPSRIDLQAHSAPLGLRFVPESSALAKNIPGQLLIAYHGSWNRREPTGYKVVVADISGAEPVVRDLITGWYANGDVWGRPVDVAFAPDGSLFITDDKAGAVYRVTTPE